VSKSDLEEKAVLVPVPRAARGGGGRYDTRVHEEERERERERSGGKTDYIGGATTNTGI
jgi:hypothetical protein